MAPPPPEPSYPDTTSPGCPNELKQEEALKFNLIKMIEAFKEDMNPLRKYRKIHSNR